MSYILAAVVLAQSPGPIDAFRANYAEIDFRLF